MELDEIRAQVLELDRSLADLEQRLSATPKEAVPVASTAGPAER
jgi:hypothetical protein